MQKNHFFYPYTGNKRTELHEISKYIPENIDIVVEPFCGSCAVSFHIWTTNKDKKFILNDNNKMLQELYETIKDTEKEKHFEAKLNEALEIIRNSEDKKKEYQRFATKDTLMGWFLGHKYYSIRPFLFPQHRTGFKPVKLSDTPIYHFYKEADITFTCKDGIDCLMEYQNNPKAYIFLDPPYLNACNNYYSNPTTDIYEYIVNGPSINKAPAYIVIVVEENYITNLIFSDKKYFCKYYEKTYQTSKKLTRHKLVMNIQCMKLYRPVKIMTRIK